MPPKCTAHREPKRRVAIFYLYHVSGSKYSVVHTLSIPCVVVVFLFASWIGTALVQLWCFDRSMPDSSAYDVIAFQFAWLTLLVGLACQCVDGMHQGAE